MEYMKYLKELSMFPGVSGDEYKVREFIKERVINFADGIYEDNIGNLVVFKRGKSNEKNKIMLVAHMDEVGFMVTRINNDGTISFQPVGGINVDILPGKKVKIGKDALPGVIGFKAVHLQKKDEVEKPPRWEELKIYAGFKSREDAIKKVKIGDYICFDYPFEDVGRAVIGKAFDDRGGCSLLMDLIEYGEFKNDVYFVFTVQEEVGLRGSGVAIERIKVDVAIVVEVTATGDEPSMEKDRLSTIMGMGPAVTIAHRGYVVPKKVLNWIISTAEREKIKYQFRRRTIGATDALAIATRKSGTPVGVISVPARYIHGPSSIMSKEDYIETFKLLMKLLNSIFHDTMIR